MSSAPPPSDLPRQPAVTKEPPPGHKFPCLKCGARLDFDPRGRSLACPYCGYREEIKQGRTDAVERDLEEYLSRQTGETVVAGRACEVKCTTCAAVVLLEDKVAADPLKDVLDAHLRSGKSGVEETAEGKVFLTVHVPPTRLVVIGAVHISQALAPIASSSACA